MLVIPQQFQINGQIDIVTNVLAYRSMCCPGFRLEMVAFAADKTLKQQPGNCEHARQLMVVSLC